MATIRLIPSSYSVSSTSYLSVSDASNMYNNTDNTTYATITNSRSSTTSYYLYISGFNFSDIPSNATINSFTVKIKVRESRATTSTSYRMYLCNGTTATSDYASTMPGTSVATISFDNVSSSWATLSGYGSNLAIRINCRRASRFTTSYMYVYGAEIEVDYSLPVSYTITSTITNGTIVSENPMTISGGKKAIIAFDGNTDCTFKSMTMNGTSVTPTKNKSRATEGVTYSTNYSTYSSYSFSNCYDGNASTYFWSAEAQATGKYILIQFENPITLSSFSTYSSNSGDYPHSNNYLQVSSDGGSAWTDVGAFSNSQTTTFSNLSLSNINAIRIYAKSDISNWLVINTITMVYEDYDETENITSEYYYIIDSVDEDKTIEIIFEKNEADEDTFYVKVGGTWKEVKGAYKKIDGVWTLITYTYDSTKQLVYKGTVSSTSSDE